MLALNLRHPLLYFLFAVLCAPLALASESTQPQAPVVLSGLTATDEFARAKVAELKRDGVKSVELYHVGKDIPVELDGLARWLTASGIHVFFKHTSLAEIEKLNGPRSEALADSALGTMTLLNYEGKRPGRAKLAAEIRARIRHFFGVPGGISFMTYKQNRTVKERVVEGGVAIVKAGVSSLVLYHTLSAKALLGQEVNVLLPVVVSAAFSLGFDYWQRGNAMFKAQGVNYDFNTGMPVMNRKFYLLTSLIHSIIVREAIMVAAHTTAAGFKMGWDHFLAGISTSLKGLLGKAPVEMFIARGQKRHGPWWTIGWMTAWGSFYASIQILDLFQVGSHARTLFTALGAAGLGFELYRSRAAIYTGLERLFRRITRRYNAAACQTLIVTKTSVPAPTPPVELPPSSSPGGHRP